MAVACPVGQWLKVGGDVVETKVAAVACLEKVGFATQLSGSRTRGAQMYRFSAVCRETVEHWAITLL